MTISAAEGGITGSDCTNGWMHVRADTLEIVVERQVRSCPWDTSLSDTQAVHVGFSAHNKEIFNGSALLGQQRYYTGTSNTCSRVGQAAQFHIQDNMNNRSVCIAVVCMPFLSAARSRQTCPILFERRLPGSHLHVSRTFKFNHISVSGIQTIALAHSRHR